MLLNTARRALHATRRQLSDALPNALPKPPTAALAKRSQLLRDVRCSCTKYLDALEDLDLLSAKEMRVVFEKSERDLVPLNEHVERLTASRNLLAARLREVEDEDVEGHCWPGAC